MAYMFVVVVPVREKSGHKQTSEDCRIPAIITPETDQLEDTLTEVLQILKVDSDSWQKSHDEKTWQVTFIVNKEESDRILQHLFTLGIGNSPGSSVSIFWSNFHRGSVNRVEPEHNQESTATGIKAEERSEFIKSVKARLTVAQVVEAAKQKSVITFDYILFLLISSIISVVGFVENSPVFTVVSILVSPLMGPILAALFGSVIRVWKLARLGVKNEGLSLILCLCTGLVMGLIVSGVNHDGVHWGGADSWPTPQMKDRGVPRGIWVGILVSIPSGAGVALALLGGSISPLVGVAVSASLLGPVVNSGLLFACAFVSAIKPPATLEQNITTALPLGSLDCPSLENNAYTFYYTCHFATECLYLGLISLLHSLLDIVCIFVTGFIVLKIKEVAPHTAKSDTFDMFWKNDVRIARKTFKHRHGALLDTDYVTQQIQAEEKEKHISVLPEVLLDIESDPQYTTVTHSLLDRPTPGLSSGSLLRDRSRRTTRAISSHEEYDYAQNRYPVSESGDVKLTVQKYA